MGGRFVGSQPEVGADIVGDILSWDYRAFKPKSFDLITASPPCIEFSRALTTRGGRHGREVERRLDHADQLVCKVLELIDYFQPKWWWIENPATGMLKERPYMAGLQYVDIVFCQFSHWGYREPTRFWGKLPGGAVKDVVCDGYHCPNLAGKPSRVGGPRRHRVQLSSWRSSPSTTSQYRIPPALIKYLVGSLPNPQEPEPAKAPPHPLSVPVSHTGQAHPAEVTGIGACGGNPLTLRILAQDGAGNLEWINALVDTGAQAILLSSSRFGGGTGEIPRVP